MAHPQTNGQVERANDMILQGLKPRIFDQLNKFGRKWLQELPAVMWSLRTTPSRATRFTPFFLVHGAEAVLPTDLEYGSPRVRGYDEDANQRAREDSLDQLDEAHLVATPTSLLPLARTSKSFVVNYLPNTPVGSDRVNNSNSIKRATRLSPENQVTLGGYYGGHPPQKMVPFFRKKPTCAKYDST
jgi:hypothetical protein